MSTNTKDKVVDSFPADLKAMNAEEAKIATLVKKAMS